MPLHDHQPRWICRRHSGVERLCLPPLAGSKLTLPPCPPPSAPRAGMIRPPDRRGWDTPSTPPIRLGRDRPSCSMDGPLDMESARRARPARRAVAHVYRICVYHAHYGSHARAVSHAMPCTEHLQMRLPLLLLLETFEPLGHSGERCRQPEPERPKTPGSLFTLHFASGRPVRGPL